MKKFKLGLLPRLFIAIALGVAIGLWTPDWTIRALNTFGALFGQFIKFFVPFIIIGLVTPAIVETGRGAGKLLLVVLALAYASTIFAGTFAFGVSAAVYPHILSGGLDEAAQVKVFAPYFKLAIPPVMGVTTALATSFMFGLGLVAAKAEILTRAAQEMREVVSKTIQSAFVPFLPLFVLSVVADLTGSGKLGVIGGACVKMMAFAMAVSVTILLIQFTVAGLIARRNPLKALWTMLPAYLTGWGCCSSAATIPYTLAQTRKNGVSEETADLVVPLCANVHLSGSMANMVVYAVGFMVLAHEPLTVGAFAEYILMISVIAVASPGVPGGMVLACSSIAESALGFTSDRYALMIAVYMALDGMGTAANLTGDGAIALIVDRVRKRLTAQS